MPTAVTVHLDHDHLDPVGNPTPKRMARYDGFYLMVCVRSFRIAKVVLHTTEGKRVRALLDRYTVAATEDAVTITFNHPANRFVYLREIAEYDRETGLLTKPWTARPGEPTKWM